jgi:hypothetical protein
LWKAKQDSSALISILVNLIVIFLLLEENEKEGEIIVFAVFEEEIAENMHL